MSAIENKSNIKSIVSPLLDLQLSESKVKEIVTKLREVYEDITGISGYNKEENYNKAVAAEQGLAITINQTALCLKDHRRTAQFFRATIAAIHQKQEAYPDTIIRILYAGCGPYAPFFTLIAPFFESNEVQFTLLEINETSLEKAKVVTAKFGLEAYVQDYRQADAVAYEIPNNEHYHILFSETLDAGLHRECFVPILLNLLPQLDKETILIPQNVILSAVLIKQADFPNGNSDVRNPEVTYPETSVGEIFNVQKDLKPYLEKGERPSVFPTKHFQLENWKAFDFLVIYTRVQVFENLWLNRGEGLLAEPFIKDVDRVIDSNNIRFTYHLKPEVEMKIES